MQRLNPFQHAPPTSTSRDNKPAVTLEREFTIRKVPYHQCLLYYDSRSPVEVYVYGWGRSWRRRFRSMFLASRTLPQSRDVFYSTAGIEEEQMRHLANYYYMIHPFSDAWCFWEYIMAVVYLISYVLISFELASASEPVFHAVTIMKLPLNFFLWADIVLRFFLGFYSMSNAKNHRVDLRPRKIARHYACGQLCFDILSSIPVSISLEFIKDPKPWWPLKLVLLLKIFRIRTFLLYMELLLTRFGLYKQTRRMVCDTLLYILVVLWFASLFLCLRILHRHIPYTMQSVLESIHIALMELLLVGSYLPDSYVDSIFHMICYAVGFFFQVLFIARVLTFYYDRCRVRNQYNALQQQLGDYVRYKELSPSLCSRIHRYAHFKFQKHMYVEKDIMEHLTSSLQQDILMHQCEHLVGKVELFHGLPAQHLMKIVARLTCDLYLPNEIIVQAGMQANSMFFVYFGVVAVYSANGTEMCHLSDGDHFGEIALVSSQPRAATVIAIKECQLYRLNKSDFLEALDDCPELGNRLRRTALERLEDTMRTINNSGGNLSHEASAHRVASFNVDLGAFIGRTRSNFSHWSPDASNTSTWRENDIGNDGNEYDNDDNISDLQ